MRARDTRQEEYRKLIRLGNERLRSAVSGLVRQWVGVACRPQHYVIVSGHPHSEGENVVGSLDGYDVVRKRG